MGESANVSVRTFLSWSSVAASVVAALGAFVASWVDRGDFRLLFQKDTPSLEERREEEGRNLILHDVHQSTSTLSERYKMMEDDAKATREELARVMALVSAPGTAPAASAFANQVAGIHASIDKAAKDSRNALEEAAAVDSRLKNIEAVVLSDPTKALALPLLQRDVQAVTQETERGLTDLKSENDRVYDLMKWVLGLVGFVSFSQLGIAVANVFKKDPAPDKSKAT